MPTTVEDVGANVDLLIEEARRQIDQELTTAGDIDGRSGAFLGLLGGVTGIAAIFADLNFKDPSAFAATAITAVLAVLSTIAFTLSLWPQGGASYGAEVPVAVDMADQFDRLTYKRGILRSLSKAITANREYLKRRQDALKAGELFFALAILGLVVMILTGAFIPKVTK